jgi:Amidohydrolase ring-opening protein (Amido_AtzD_TrzD)
MILVLCKEWHCHCGKRGDDAIFRSGWRCFRLPAAYSADASGVVALVACGVVLAKDVRAIFGKTEGDGCVDDFIRGYVAAALHVLAAARPGLVSALPW